LKAAYEAQAAANAAAANAEAAAADANAAAANADAAAANANAAAAQQGSQGGGAALTPEVKEMIAEEVKAQLAAEQAAAQLAAQQAAAQNDSVTGPAAPQQSIADSYRTPAALDPNRRVFVVSSDLEVSVNDQPCLLLPGDVLKRTETVPDQDNTVAVYVLKSQKFDCAAGTTPRIQVADLQEMHNHFREQMDAGLKTLADNQGKNGLPSAPAGASPRQNADGTAAPDDAAAIAAQLNQQRQEAEQAETEVRQAASASGPAGK
jgi:molybdenum-dependent DNA-binding transcriptional regulator ModE